MFDSIQNDLICFGQYSFDKKVYVKYKIWICLQKQQNIFALVVTLHSYLCLNSFYQVFL
jgi:hypothetical protein